MSLEEQWYTTEENGFSIIQSSLHPIQGSHSALFQTLSNEFNSGQEGLRKSASVWLNDTFERGFFRGRIRTLWRRNSPSIDQSIGWGGIYFMSNINGIGTTVDSFDGYQITDKGGTLKVLKFISGTPTILKNTSEVLPLDTIRSLEVTWRSEPENFRTLITVRSGSLSNFSDLTEFCFISDMELSESSSGGSLGSAPIQFSQSEGLFSQTINHDHIASYSFDSTSIYKIIKIL